MSRAVLLNANLSNITSDVSTLQTGLQTANSHITKAFEVSAPIETSTSAHNYAVGDYLVLNNTLRVVTQAISTGQAITNSNSRVTNTGKELSQINSDLTDKMPKDAIKYHYQKNIHTDNGGLFGLDAIQDYVPIACYMIFPTSSAQRHIEINYNPANGVYYGQTSANLGIEVTTIYLKHMP